MIDYFALSLGHGLMAIALLRLVLRDDLDVDPLLGQLKADTAANRMAKNTAGGNAARPARGHDADAAEPAEAAVEDPRAQAAKRERTSSRAQAAKRERTSSRAQAAKR
jgi:hypothetical protein